MQKPERSILKALPVVTRYRREDQKDAALIAQWSRLYLERGNWLAAKAAQERAALAYRQVRQLMGIE